MARDGDLCLSSPGWQMTAAASSEMQLAGDAITASSESTGFVGTARRWESAIRTLS
jgi:hypothetical protein